METASHRTQILNYLKERGSITPMEALREFGCYRLAAQIHTLRRDGVDIVTHMTERMSCPGLRRRLRGAKPRLVRYARYRIEL